MTDDERLYAGVPRLGVPALMMSDASMGVTSPGYDNREGDAATALPASIVLAASFNPDQLAVNFLAAV
jgi:beta-glucosidase